MPIDPLLPEPFPRTGSSKIDAKGLQPEEFLKLPWVFDPENCWFDGRWWVEITLDNGMVLQKTLPQENYLPDTLASVPLAAADFASAKTGVNLNSRSRAQDVIRRFASSTYRFVLCGWGVRVGYPVPVPGLEKLSDGTPLVPVGVQWARGNYIIANLPGGIPVFFNEWRIPYACAASPKKAKEPTPPNPALHIRPDAQLPTSVQLPRTPVDSRVNDTTLPQQGLGTFIQGQ